MKKVLQREAKEAQMSNEEHEEMLRNLECKGTEYLRLQRCKVGMDYFEQLRVTVNGAFGEVRLCCANDTGEIFAMKKLKKSEMLTRGQVEHVRSETNLIVEVDSRCIVQFNYSFQDYEFLYLIMEYMPREDIMTSLMREGIQYEDVARLYNAERILAIHSIHQFDGIEASNKIKILMSTNRIDTLDQVLLRPGQLDRNLEFPIPKEEFRPGVLKIHSRLTKLVRGIVWAMQGKGFKALYGYSPPIHILYIHRTTINSEVETSLDKGNYTLEKLLNEDEMDVRGFIKRDTFEQISAPILERVKKPLEKSLAETGFALEKVHTVEVVGSGSRVPAMVKILAEFRGREPWRIMNASECVARECAVLGPTFKVHGLQVKGGFPFSVFISWKVTAPEAEDGGVGNHQSTVNFSKGEILHRV